MMSTTMYSLSVASLINTPAILNGVGDVIGAPELSLALNGQRVHAGLSVQLVSASEFARLR